MAVLIDHSHIALIIGDLNGLGHLPEFANQISGRQILVNGPTRSDRRNQYNMRMVYMQIKFTINLCFFLSQYIFLSQYVLYLII